MLDEKGLESRLRLGEDTTFELKGRGPEPALNIKPHDLARELAGLANTSGGYLILGVEDDGTVTGVGSGGDLDRLMRTVVQVTGEKIRPALSCPARKLKLGEALLLIVEVPGFAPDRSYQVDSRYYVREGSVCREARRDELARIFASTTAHFDEQPVADASREDLDALAVRSFLGEAYGATEAAANEDRYLKALKCIDDSGVPTVAGVLFLGRDPGRWLPDARISAVRMAGTELSGEFRDRKELAGRLTQQIEAAIAFLDEHVPAPARIEGWDRKTGGIAREVLREALLNAVMHRDYRAASQVRLFVFDDRVEMVNPGCLLNQLTLESIRVGGISQRRNPIIARLAALFLTARRENQGLGIPPMIAVQRQSNLPEPEFDLSGGHFRIVLRTVVPRRSEGS